MRTMAGTPHRMMAAIAAIAVVLVGCSGAEDASSLFSGDDSMQATRAGDAPDVPASDDGFEVGDEAAAEDADEGERIGDGGEVRPISDDAPTGQKLIRTAEVVIESADTSETLARIRAVAERAGGYTATSDLQRDDEGTVRGTLTLRVPTAQLDDVVSDLEELGEVVPVSRIDERDVTTEHADLQARIANLTAYESELRALLADVRETTTRPEDLLSIFERIRTVREEIDLLEGRLAALSDRVALATVVVSLRPVDAEPEPEVEPWAPGETFEDAIAATLRLLRGLGDGLIWLVVTGVPVLLAFLGLPALLLVLLLRRWRRPKSPGGTPSPPPAPAG